MSVASTAADLDEAIATLETAAKVFQEACIAADQAHRDSQRASSTANGPHPCAVHGDWARYFRAAISARPLLAKALGVPARPAFSIAEAIS